MLLLLDELHQLLRAGIAAGGGGAQRLAHRRPARHLGDQQAPGIPHGRGVDVLKGSGDLHHPVDVHPPFVGEGAPPHIGHAIVRNHVGGLSHRPDAAGEPRHILRRDAPVSQLQLEGGDEGGKVGVPAPLPEAQKRPLHLGGARLDRQDGVRLSAAGIIVAVDAEVPLHRRPDRLDGIPDLPGQGPAVGVAEHQTVRPGPAGRLEHRHGIVSVLAVAVKKVFRVEKNR